MSLLDTASLLLTPNAYKEGKLYSVIPSDGSGDFTFTRATTATRVNSDGLVELVPYNLLTWSEDFTNILWTKQRVNIVANSTTAPNGTLTADSIIANTIFEQHRIDQTPTSSAGPQTFSIYVKPKGYDYVGLRIGGAGALYNVSTGEIVSVNSGITASIENADNGWYRCIITRVVLTNETCRVNISDGTSVAPSFSGNDIDGLFIWGAQLVEGTNALPYQRTETRLNIPRIDSSLGGCPSILLEPQRTNLALQSSSFDSASWVSSNSIVVANYAISPSGIQDADLFYPSSTGTGRRRTQAITVVNGTTYTSFCYVKAAGFSWIRMTDVNAAGSSVWFDVSNGEVGAIVGTLTPSITDVGNGWYRCSVTSTASSTSGIFYLALADINGTATATASGTNGLYLWGAQLEVGAYATSYIPTTTASVTRNLETVVKTGATALIGQTEGTMFWEGIIPNSSSVIRRIFTLSDGTTNNAIHIQNPPTINSLQFVVVNGGAIQSAITVTSAFTFGQMFKVGVAYANDDFVIYINGVQGGTDTSGTIPTTSKISFDRGNDTTHFEGFVKTAVLWKERLTNDQLAQLTTI